MHDFQETKKDSSFSQSVSCYVPTRESGHTGHEAHRSKGLALHRVQATWVCGVFMAVSWSGWHHAQGGLAHNHRQRGDGCQPPTWDCLWRAVDCTPEISLLHLLCFRLQLWTQGLLSDESWWRKWMYHHRQPGFVEFSWRSVEVAGIVLKEAWHIITGREVMEVSLPLEILSGEL